MNESEQITAGTGVESGDQPVRRKKRGRPPKSRVETVEPKRQSRQARPRFEVSQDTFDNLRRGRG